MNESSYYLKVNNQVEGPFTIGQIYDLWAARKINSQTPFARYDAMENWQPLSDLTLKISAPKSAPPRAQPESEPPGPAPAKVRHAAAPQLSEDELPSLSQYPSYSQPESPRRETDKAGVPTGRKFSLGLGSWLCVTAGLALTVGSLLMPPPTGEATNLEPRMVLGKLSGVIGGAGLLCLGGLLAIARSMEQIAASFRVEPRPSGERKAGSRE